MLELEVILDFACCGCGHAVGVTLKCAGKGLSASNAKATFVVPCPTCSKINQVYFSPSGEVHHVAPHRECRHVHEPSLN
jgi:phage FluMu protein Com